MYKKTTIAALGTAVGYAGIAVIRISGKEAHLIAEQLTHSKIPPRYANFRNLYDDKKQIIDTAIVIFFPSPQSFTGEDIVELQIHGNPLLVDQCLQRLYRLGAEMAQPGEFSERAFLNNKIDLTQAEALMDLIHASSTQSLKIARQSLHGEFSSGIYQLADQMLKLRAQIELSLDFSDEQVDFIDENDTRKNIQELIQKLERLLAIAMQGKKLTEGVNVVITGQPNVGKSTLLNCLLGEQRAIVSQTAGTTRDVLSEHLILDGLSIQITDTAGLRHTVDDIEQEGINRAKQAAQHADLLLHLTTSEHQHTDQSLALIDANSTPRIILINKCDLQKLSPQDLSTEHQPCIRISAQHNLGIDLLTQKIKQILNYYPQQAKFSIRGRSIEYLRQSKNYLDEALNTLHKGPELSADSIKLAHQSLQNITGKIITDNILEVIFREFCIGK